MKKLKDYLTDEIKDKFSCKDDSGRINPVRYIENDFKRIIIVPYNFFYDAGEVTNDTHDIKNYNKNLCESYKGFLLICTLTEFPMEKQCLEHLKRFVDAILEEAEHAS